MSTPRRQAAIQRKTGETDINLKLDLDGVGQGFVTTGVGFLDHMLHLLARHALWNLEVTCMGDLDVDAHHSTEDIGICLGQAIDHALGDRAGILRYGHCILPMDESLVTVALDLGGRPYIHWQVEMPSPRVGTFDSELVEEFWRAAALHARMNFHVILHHGRNTHHVAEAIFKGAARALRSALAVDPRQPGIPSTKGTI